MKARKYCGTLVREGTEVIKPGDHVSCSLCCGCGGGDDVPKHDCIPVQHACPQLNIRSFSFSSTYPLDPNNITFFTKKKRHAALSTVRIAHSIHCVWSCLFVRDVFETRFYWSAIAFILVHTTTCSPLLIHLPLPLKVKDHNRQLWSSKIKWIVVRASLHWRCTNWSDVPDSQFHICAAWTWLVLAIAIIVIWRYHQRQRRDGFQSELRQDPVYHHRALHTKPASGQRLVYQNGRSAWRKAFKAGHCICK